MIDRLVQHLPTLLVCGFFAVLFLQSGLDKVFDRAGNLAWMTPHFEKSPFKGKVGFFLSLLTILELASGAACAAAVVSLLAGLDPSYSMYALGLATFTLLCLFAGQRLAKDYAGAASLAAYFAVAVIGLSLSPASVP